MNSDQSPNPRQTLESSLTALLLGELPPDHAAALRELLAYDAELARLHDRLKCAMELVREIEATPTEPAVQTTPLKLSEERREKLLQQFKTVAASQFAKPARQWAWLAPVGAAAAVVMVLGATVLVFMPKKKMESRFASSAPAEISETVTKEVGRPQAHSNVYSLNVVGYVNVPDRESFRQLKESKDLQFEEKSLARKLSEPNQPAQVIAEPGRYPIGQPPVQMTTVTAGDDKGLTGGRARTPIVLPVEGRSADSEKNAEYAGRIDPQQHGSALVNPALAEGQGTGAVGFSSDGFSLRRSGFAGQGGYSGGIASSLAAPAQRLWSAATAHALDLTTDKDGRTILSAAAENGTATPVDSTTGLRIEGVTTTPGGGLFPAPLENTKGKEVAGKQDVPVLGDMPIAGRLFRPDSLNYGADLVASNVANMGDLAWASSSAGQQRLSGFFEQSATPAVRAQPKLDFKILADTARYRMVTPETAGSVTAGSEKQAAASANETRGIPQGLAKSEDRALGFDWYSGNALFNRGQNPSMSTDKMQQKNGNPLISDGSTQQLGIASLKDELRNSDDMIARRRYSQAPDLAQAIPAESDAKLKEAISAESERGETRSAAEQSGGTKLALAQQRLDELRRLLQVTETKLAAEGTDLGMPKSSMVDVVDLAEAEPTEKPGPFGRMAEKLSGGVERKARVKIERDRVEITPLASARSSAAYDPYFVQSELDVIRSDAVLGRVNDKLKLSDTWGQNGRDTKPGTAETLERLRKKLDLRPVPNTSLVEIGIKSDTPQEAARLANAIAEAYHDQRMEERKKLASDDLSALTNRLAKQEAQVRDAEKELAKLEGSEASSSASQPRMVLSGATLQRLEQLRTESRAELRRQRALLEALKGLKPEGLAQAMPANTIQDSLLVTLLEQSAIAEQRLNAAEKAYAPGAPEIVETQNLLSDLNRKTAARARGLIQGVEARSDALEQSLKELDTEIENASKKEPAKSTKTSPKATLEPDPEVQTAQNAFSTFSLNVSDVSFKLAAASLEKGVLPEAGTIRSEEFINAFDYRDPEAPLGVPVAFAWERAQYPFAQGRDLLRFSLKTAAQGRQAGRPLNLVLLLDNSGSMERADRVSIIREALSVLAGLLQAQDTFSVVTFARTARLWVDGVPGNQAAQVAEEISKLTPQGGTNLEEAMNLAYQTALRHYRADGINRVVLLTDGAANLGNVEPETLKLKVETNRKQGVAFDCFGIGWEGYNDDLLEVLTRNGDGRYGFINTPEEAATEFAGQLAGALHVAASDVKVQVEFNPARVTAYRQIGYAKHQLTKEQFRDNTVDAAEIGAAEAGNALYVLETNPAGEGPLAIVRIRYKMPGTAEYHEHEWVVPYNGNAVALEQASTAMRLAATASAFSEWLASSPYAAEVTPDRLLGYLRGVPEVYGADGRPKKLEWMVRQAKSIAGSTAPTPGQAVKAGTGQQTNQRTQFP